MTSKLVVNTIEADTGISSVSFASSISLSSTSVFHLGDAGINIGADTNINRAGNGVLGFNINDSEKLRIASDGQLTHNYDIASNGDAALILNTDDATKASSILFRANNESRARIDVQRLAGDGAQLKIQVSQMDNSNTMLDAMTIAPVTSGDTTPDVTLTGNLKLSSTGRIFSGDGGNATNPMFANISDTNTGLFYPSADQLAFTTGGSERLRINNYGLVTRPFQYHLHADRNGTQNGYNAGANYGTPMIFNRVVSETKDSSLSSCLNTSNGLFTAPVTGVYIFNAAAYTGTGQIFGQSWFTLNGGRCIGTDWVINGNYSFIQNTQVIRLAAGNTVGFHPYASGQNNVSIYENANHTYFKVSLIG